MTKFSGDALREFCELYADPLRKLPLLIVHHIRSDTVLLVKTLQMVGVEIVAVIGPEYSAQQRAQSEIVELGIEARYFHHTDVEKHVEAISKSLAISKFGLVDTGGYAAYLDESLRPNFVVELTNRGLWNYKDAKWTNLLHFASAENKQLENVFVGKAIVRAVLDAMNGSEAIAHPIGVIGYGGIGTNVAKALQRSGKSVCVHDSDPLKGILAATQGFEVLKPSDLINTCRIIIGCTGRDCLKDEDVCFDQKTHLFSGSSRGIEFDSVRMQHNAIVESNGEPVNLATSSLPIEIAEHLFLNVCAGIVHANTKEIRGVVEIDPELQKLANEKWLKHHGYEPLYALARN